VVTWKPSVTTQPRHSTATVALWRSRPCVQAQDSQIKPMAPLILRALTGLLDQGEATEQPDGPLARSWLGFTYQAVGQLAVRAPQLLRKDVGMAQRLFAALGSTPSNATRVVLQDAVLLLGSAYQDAPCARQGGAGGPPARGHGVPL